MRVHKKNRSRGSSGSYWTSYADMMAGLMLVFTLVMVFSIFRYMEAEQSKQTEVMLKDQELTAKNQELIDKENLLNTKEDELQTQSSELEEALALLATQQSTLDTQNTALATQQAELDEKNQQLQNAQALVNAAQINLQTQRQQLADQETQLQSAQASMAAQQERIDALIGVRTQIISDLAQEFRAANLDVSVDTQTGAITLQGAVLFDVNQSSLKTSGMSLLDSFIPVYVRTLLSSNNSDFVAEIIIEGHTDSTGPFLENLRLSQDRAYEVAEYCLRDGFGGLTNQERDLLRTIMTANGRSWSNPIYNADGSENREASRRVEFKFRLKEAEMINEMSAIMEGQQ